MLLIDPRISPASVPPGSRARVINGPQREYVDMPAVITPSGTFITRWELSAAERAALVRGEDLFLTILTYNAQPVQPVLLSVGPLNWTEL